jgi:enediyne biosynthesis protein CalE5
MFAIPMRTAMTMLNLPAPAPGTPGPLSRPTAEAIGRLLSDGGFSGIEVEEMELEFEWDSVADFVGSTRALAAPLNALLDQHPQEVRDETWAAIEDAVTPYGGADGSVRLTNLALLAAGKA